MYVVVAFLALGAVCVAFFIALFAGGALVGLGGSCMRALRAASRSQHTEVATTLPKAVVRPHRPPESLRVKNFVDSGAAYTAA
jgi:hypothetical protein